MGNALFEFFPGALIHIAHGAANRDALLVHQHQSLHLGAEGDARHRVRCDGAVGEYLPGGLHHGLPPLPGFLLRPAAGEDIEPIAHLGAFYQRDLFVHGEQAGLYPRGADVIGQDILHVSPSFSLSRWEMADCSKVKADSRNFKSSSSTTLSSPAASPRYRERLAR